jgi:hypothetical protein
MVLMVAVKIQRGTTKNTALGKSKMTGFPPFTNLDFQENTFIEFG